MPAILRAVPATHSAPIRHFLSVADLTPSELSGLLDDAERLKRSWIDGSGFGRSAGPLAGPLAGRAVALIFQKPSLRTRVSFEVGIGRLGGQPVTIRSDEVGLGSRETDTDIGRTLERYVDAIVARVFDHEVLERLAATSSVPVVNALSDAEHPCQALADLMTLQERWSGWEGRRLAFVGDGNNVASSLLLGAAMLGLSMSVATPVGYEVPVGVVGRARALASVSGAKVELGHDPAVAVKEADAVYTDVWASMGQEAEAAVRREVFRDHSVTVELLALAPGAVVMHCLPAHRGEEITSEVLDGPQSIVFDQAENRMWAQMALLSFLVGS